MVCLRISIEKSAYIRVLFFLSLFFVNIIGLSGQDYVRIDTANLAVRQVKSKEYLEESKQYLNDFNKNFKGREKSYMLKNFKESHKEFNEELLRGDYIFDDRFSHYLDSIFEVIRQGNPKIPAGLKFYLSRNISLNAASMGDNRFIVNLGTFYFFDNQHQLGAIISHELAHSMLDHQMKSLERHYRAEKQDAKQHLSSVKSSRWNRGEKALERFRSMLYQTSTERRQDEFEADSLGYIFFRNSKFNKQEYANIYDMMALYDTIRPVGVEEKMYREYFDLPTQPFNESWMKKEDFSSYDYSKYESKFQEDSLKSHPEMKERVEKLKQLFPELNDTLSVETPDKNYEKLSEIATKERMFSRITALEFTSVCFICKTKMIPISTKPEWGNFSKKLQKPVRNTRSTVIWSVFHPKINPIATSHF